MRPSPESFIETLKEMDPQMPPVEVDLNEIRVTVRARVREVERKEEIVFPAKVSSDVYPTRDLPRLRRRGQRAGRDDQRQMPRLRDGLEREQSGRRGAPPRRCGGEKNPVQTEERRRATRANMAMIAGLVGGAMMLIAILGLAIVILNREPPPSQTAVAEVEETIKPFDTGTLSRVIDLPEEQRRRIYKDYRTVARTTVEKPLFLPQGSKPRQNLEDMLQKTFDRELTAFRGVARHHRRGCQRGDQGRRREGVG